MTATKNKPGTTISIVFNAVVGNDIQKATSTTGLRLLLMLKGGSDYYMECNLPSLDQRQVSWWLTVTDRQPQTQLTI